MRSRAVLVLVLSLGLAGLAAAESPLPAPGPAGAREEPALFPAAPGEPAPGLPTPSPAPGAVSGIPPRFEEPKALPPVSMTWAAFRLLGAVAGVGLLLAASVLAARRLLQRSSLGLFRRRAGGLGREGGWLARWVPESTPAAARIHVVSRGWLGPRESVGVVQVGGERFLIGITAGSISLLSRLSADGAEAPAREERPPDFARELTEVVTPREIPAEAAIRSALTRSRERLHRLRPVASGGTRG